MKKRRIVRRSLSNLRKGKTDWARVRALTDAQITAAAKDDPDAPILDDAFWESAEVFRYEPKAAVSLRVDRDVLDFFKSKGRGYQTRINSVLRAYMAQERKKAG